MSFNGTYLKRVIELVSERFLVRCQLESQGSGMSRDGTLWRTTVYVEQSANSGDVTFYDQSCAIFVSCEKQKSH